MLLITSWWMRMQKTRALYSFRDRNRSRHKTYEKSFWKEQKTLEGKQILKTLQPNDYVILLDTKGREFTSPEFAHFIEKKGLMGLKRLIFVVGGPYGFSEDMYNRADEKVSLSKMTFTHEMVRLVLWNSCIGQWPFWTMNLTITNNKLNPFCFSLSSET